MNLQSSASLPGPFLKPSELFTSSSMNAIASASIGTPDVAHSFGGGTSGDTSSSRRIR